jgi:hypothetical protein
VSHGVYHPNCPFLVIPGTKPLQKIPIGEAMAGSQVSDSWGFFQVLQRKGAIQQRRGADFSWGFLGTMETS